MQDTPRILSEMVAAIALQNHASTCAVVRMMQVQTNAMAQTEHTGKYMIWEFNEKLT